MSTEEKIQLSLVIPVYNSAAIVGQTIDRCVAFCEASGLTHEIILVNDGSKDESWEIVRAKALENAHIIAIDLLKNYGQHTAIYCGLQVSCGRYVVTLDDDLQNPPEEIKSLLAGAEAGHDLVFGRFRQKHHALYRRLGSGLVLQLNRRLFHCPRDLVVSNFRLMTGSLAHRICAYKTPFPYITGLSLMFAASPANVWVEHHPRPVGKSTYSLFKLIRFVLRILFSYSPYPVWITAGAGGAGILLSLMAFVFLAATTGVPGGSIVDLLTIFAAISTLIGLLTIIAMIAIIGEYLARLMKSLAHDEIYAIRERIH